MKIFTDTGAVSQEAADRAASSRLWFLDLLRGITRQIPSGYICK